MNIGVRDLRDGLSRHLASVQQGHTITVTDHGRPVARIVPIGVPTALERLIAEGRVTPPVSAPADPPSPIDAGGTASDLVADQRR